MKIYSHLTIDLDYWMNHASFRGMKAFLKRVIELNPERISLVKYHHHVLPLVDGNRINQIINVDYHSDISDIPHRFLTRKDFNEGTWLNYANLKKRQSYVWYYPHKKCPSDSAGYCHVDENPFKSTTQHADYGWKSITMKQGLPDDDILSTVISVSICVSPNWLDFRKAITAYKVLHSLNLAQEHDLMLCLQDPKSIAVKQDMDILDRLGIK